LNPSVAVTFTVNVPAAVNVCVPLEAFVDDPSPQVIWVVSGEPWGSVQVPVAATDRGAGPLVGETVSVHVGGLFAVVAVTVCDAEPDRLKRSVAVTFTVKEPAAVNVCVPLEAFVDDPSPQVIWVVSGEPWGSVQVPVAVTGKGTRPVVGKTESIHVGG
jgi:hypothetical protein